MSKFQESRSLADQFEVISSSEIKDAIIEAGVPNHDEEQSEEEEEDGEEEEEESSDEEDEESEKEVSCRHHSKPQSAQRQWKKMTSSPSRITGGGLGLMNDEEDD